MKVPPKVEARFHGVFEELADPQQALEAALEQYNKELLGEGAVEAAVDASAETNDAGEVVGDEIDFGKAIAAAINHVLGEGDER